ncbi:MAG: hypothetical protein ACXVDJ_11275 [Tumebacillaceae bacterium]
MRKRTRVAILAGVVVLQVTGLWTLEEYLTPTGAAAAKATMASVSEVQPRLQVPDDAVVADIDANGNTLAYVDHHEQLVVKNRSGRVIGLSQVVGVTYLQWLDNGVTLFYERDNYGQNEIGVFQVPEDKVVPLYDISGNDISIDKVYKSSYSQSIHLMYEDGDQSYIGSYQEITGWQSAPLNGIKPQESWFDEKEDVLYIKDTDGTVWRFRNGDLLH